MNSALAIADWYYIQSTRDGINCTELGSEAGIASLRVYSVPGIDILLQHHLRIITEAARGNHVSELQAA